MSKNRITKYRQRMIWIGIILVSSILITFSIVSIVPLYIKAVKNYDALINSTPMTVVFLLLILLLGLGLLMFSIGIIVFICQKLCRLKTPLKRIILLVIIGFLAVSFTTSLMRKPSLENMRPQDAQKYILWYEYPAGENSRGKSIYKEDKFTLSNEEIKEVFADPAEIQVKPFDLTLIMQTYPGIAVFPHRNFKVKVVELKVAPPIVRLEVSENIFPFERKRIFELTRPKSEQFIRIIRPKLVRWNLPPLQ